MRNLIRAMLAAALALFLFTLPVLADDWVAVKLRGIVLQLVDGQWSPLVRGDVVPDTRVIRTMPSGRVEFMRDKETVDLGPSTQIQIYDKTGRRFTTVKQYFGTVSVEANVENVQHFGVETPYLAAVVKGTKFIVTSGAKSSTVKVTRGHVAVEDLLTHAHVLLSVGQSATAGAGGNLAVTGRGKLPVVYGSNGVPLVGVSVGTNGVAVKVGGLASVQAGSGGIDANVAGVAGVQTGSDGVNVKVGNVVGASVGGSNGGLGVNVHVLGLHLGL